jgi:hypothetical protein
MNSKTEGSNKIVHIKAESYKGNAKDAKEVNKEKKVGNLKEIKKEVTSNGNNKVNNIERNESKTKAVTIKENKNEKKDGIKQNVAHSVEKNKQSTKDSSKAQQKSNLKSKQIKDTPEEIEKRKLQSHNFDEFVENSGLNLAFQLIFDEIISKQIQPELYFSYTAMRLRQLGTEIKEATEYEANNPILLQEDQDNQVDPPGQEEPVQ